MTFRNEGTFSLTSSVQDLPVILKLNNFQSLEKALNCFMEQRCLLSEQAQKVCRWPLITSVQCSLSLHFQIFKPQHEVSNYVVGATSIGLDQPAHTRSLIRAFPSRLNINEY